MVRNFGAHVHALSFKRSFFKYFNHPLFSSHMFFHLPCRGMVPIQALGIGTLSIGSFCLCIVFNTCSTACAWKGKGCKRLVIRRISLFDARYPKRDTAWHNIPYTSLLHPLGVTVEKVSSCARPLFPSKSATSIFVSSFYPRPVGEKWSAPPVLWEGMDSPSVANLVILKRCFAIRIGDFNCCVLSSCLCVFPVFLFCSCFLMNQSKKMQFQ